MIRELKNISSVIEFQSRERERAYLLPQAYPWAGIERQEYERVRGDVLANAVVEEPIRIEHIRYSEILSAPRPLGKQKEKYRPSGPHRSLRRCIKKTLYGILAGIRSAYQWLDNFKEITTNLLCAGR